MRLMGSWDCYRVSEERSRGSQGVSGVLKGVPGGLRRLQRAQRISGEFQGFSRVSGAILGIPGGYKGAQDSNVKFL